MSKQIVMAVLCAALLSTPASAGRRPNDTTPAQFFENYVCEIATFEQLRDDASKELDADKTNAPMACIHSGERYDLEAAAAIRMLRDTRLIGVQKLLQDVPQTYAEIYDQRRTLMAQLTKVCTTFAEGPKQGIDYAGLAALMPKIRAQLEYLDKTAFDASPLVFETLVSDVPDSQGHMSHLVISCDDRKRLVSQIDSYFGPKLAAKGANYAVSQAQIFRAKLLEFKCAEESR